MPEQKYKDLNALLAADSKAKAFYEKLPDYAREQIAQRGENVNSFASLSDYADNLLRGDG